MQIRRLGVIFILIAATFASCGRGSGLVIPNTEHEPDLQSDLTPAQPDLPRVPRPRDDDNGSIPPIPNDPGRIPDENADPRAMRLGPEEVRARLLSDGVPIAQALNRLHAAKDQLSIVRSQLLPSLNLGALLVGTVNPVFALSSVEFLLPFLVPSRWFDYFKQKDLLKAEKVAYLLTELNEFASAYSILLTVRSDLDLRAFAGEEVDDMERLEKLVRNFYQIGAASRDDLLTAQSQADFARMRLRKIEELLTSERETFRKALAFEADAPISIPSFSVPASTWESTESSSVIEHALGLAPEAIQLGYLKSAAKKDRWSKVFGFITGFGMNASDPLAGGNALSTIGFAGQVSLGFAIFPTLKLSHRNEVELDLRTKELGLEVTRVLQTVLGQLGDIRERHALAVRAEDATRKVYRSRLIKYEMGITSLKPVIDARFDVRQATTERLKAAMELNLARVTLHRTMLTDEFSKIPGCEKLNEDMSPEEEKEFKKIRDQKTVDQICRGL